MSLEAIDEEIHNEGDATQLTVDTREEVDTEEVEPKGILKPKRGRKRLSDKQKKALEKGRRNHQLRMAKKKIEEIEQKQKEEEEMLPKPEPKPKPKPKKKTIVYESETSSDDDEEKVVIVKRKKKKKPKKKIVYESETSSDDESDVEPPPPITRQQTQYPPQPPPFRHPLYTYRGGLFR